MRILALCLLSCLAVSAVAAEPERESIDYAALDQPVLAILAENLQARVDALEAEIEQLKAQLAGSYGASDGEDAVVSGDVVSIPEGTWRVQIVANQAPDVGAIHRQIAAEKQQIPQLDAQVNAARDLLRTMQSARESYVKDGELKYRDKYSSSQQRSQAGAVAQAERDRRALDMKIRELEQDLREATTRRIVSAVDESGGSVLIRGEGVTFGAAASLRVGEWYDVSGRGRFGGESGGRIYIKAASPVPAPSSAAE